MTMMDRPARRAACRPRSSSTTSASFVALALMCLVVNPLLAVAGRSALSLHKDLPQAVRKQLRKRFSSSQGISSEVSAQFAAEAAANGYGDVSNSASDALSDIIDDFEESVVSSEGDAVMVVALPVTLSNDQEVRTFLDDLAGSLPEDTKLAATSFLDIGDGGATIDVLIEVPEGETAVTILQRVIMVAQTRPGPKINFLRAVVVESNDETDAVFEQDLAVTLATKTVDVIGIVEDGAGGTFVFSQQDPTMPAPGPASSPSLDDFTPTPGPTPGAGGGRSYRLLREEYSDFPAIEAPAVCSDEPELKFYLHHFESLQSCLPRRLEDQASQLSYAQAKGFHVQNLGASFFFQQQVESHPQRTLDPAEADLFVVPSVLDIASLGGTAAKSACGGMNFTTVVDTLASELRNSSWYQRHQGRDHLILFHHYQPKNLMVQGKPLYSEGFRSLIRNMIIGFRYRAGAWSKGSNMRWLPDPLRVITHPHLSPAGFRTCRVVKKESLAQPGEAEGRLVCGINSQDTFETFLTSRNLTMFFYGTAGRTDMEDTEIDLRTEIATATDGVYAPNFVKYTSDEKQHISTERYESLMEQAKLSIHIRGHDAASSRVMDAWSAGTPQLFLSDRWKTDIAPFLCKIPWDQAVHHIPEQEFTADPHGTMQRHLDMLTADDMAGLRKLWESQRSVANEILWHAPGSHVAENILADAFRVLSAATQATDSQ